MTFRGSTKPTLGKDQRSAPLSALKWAHGCEEHTQFLIGLHYLPRNSIGHYVMVFFKPAWDVL